VSRRIEQAEALLAALDWDTAHCRHVRDLALALFDQLAALHSLGRDDRDLLEAAALLHDIGWKISGAKHHKHSYRLIHENRRSLSDFPADQVELIANIARYHRKALPSPKHEPFAALSAADQQRVCQLAALLRVADGLDRPHRQAVQRLNCRVEGGMVRVTIQVRLDPDDHLTGGERKRDLFEEIFARQLEIRVEALTL
jgi:exopolyphosphatase / guanosine-5'-triphosphate,3'-diphosphate pyrophosphatase